MQRLLTRLLATSSIGLLNLCSPAQAGPIQTLLGLPEWVEFSVDYTTEPMGGLLGGENPSAATWFQQTVVGLTIGSGLGKETSNWREIDHWQVNLELTNAAGDPDLATELGSFFNPQTVVNPVGTWITQASVSRNQGDGWWSAQAGLMSIGPQFLTAPALDNYTNATLNNTLNVAIPGVPINPFVAPGITVAAHSSSLGDLRYGYYNLDSETAIAASLGVDPGQPDVRGSVQVLEWSLNPLAHRKELLAPIEGKDGTTVARQLPAPLLQLGGMLSNTAWPGSAGSELGEGLNRIVYGTITWPVTLPIGIDNRLWLAGNLGLDPAKNPVPSFAAGGWLSQGVLPNRPDDVLALGITRNSFSPTLNPGLTYEGVIELNYSINISEVVQVQPLMQWLINPSGSGTVPGSWIGGVQVNLNL